MTEEHRLKEGNALHIQPVLSYMHIARQLLDEFGFEGEAAVREALVEFSAGRGSYLRKKHQSLGMKTNLSNHFYYNANPYHGVSFDETIGHVTKEEDVRECFSCPTMEALIARGERYLARTYCEETHPVLWQSYAPGAIVNLGRTLSMEGSDRCTFNVFLRPGRLTPQQRKDSFEEYDPDFMGDRRDEFVYPTPAEGANLKAVLMISALYHAAKKHFGQPGIEAVKRGLDNFVNDVMNTVFTLARESGTSVDDAYLERMLMVGRDIEKDRFWDELSDSEAKEFASEWLYNRIERKYREYLTENK